MNNIQASFKATSIWPLNSEVVDKYLAPSQQFVEASSKLLASNSKNEESDFQKDDGDEKSGD